MSEVLEKVATSFSDEEKSREPQDCDWSSCKAEHEGELKYPNDGNLTRDGRGKFRGRCFSANMEPWKELGKVRPRLSKLGNLYKTKTFEYRIQAHHLIPVKLLNNTTTLKHNLKLIGYDIDNPQENGLMLPMDDMDIPIHDLQKHSGDHCRAYKKPIEIQLQVIEEAYDGICNRDKFGTLLPQEGVLKQLEILSGKARKQIINIKKQKNFWPLHENSLALYKKTKKEYARRERLFAQKQK